MTDPLPLAQAIAQLQALRGSLGDAAVDAAIDALRRSSPAASTAAPTPAAAPRIRQVSILFADVVGSTTLLGQVDAEDAAGLLDVAVQGFAEAVQAWGGQVLRVTGDGIKAGFGVDGLREDEAERAVRAGLQILRVAEQHAAELASELGVGGFGVRVGIHTGPVLLGGGLEAERSAIGEAVNLAARMEQSAPPGRLRISDATWALVRGLFTAEAQLPLRVKGHEAPLRTWLVTGAASGADLTVQRGVDGVAPPMIGRETELARLVAWHADIGTTGRPGAALVLAEAGVGKTRLQRAGRHARARLQPPPAARGHLWLGAEAAAPRRPRAGGGVAGRARGTAGRRLPRRDRRPLRARRRQCQRARALGSRPPRRRGALRQRRLIGLRRARPRAARAHRSCPALLVAERALPRAQ